jgi:hypothetical protein
VRPVDYAEALAGAASRLVFVEEGGAARPPWWEAVRCGPKAEPTAVPDLASGLRLLRGR